VSCGYPNIKKSDLRKLEEKKSLINIDAGRASDSLEHASRAAGLAVADLTCKRGDHTVFSGLSFEVNAGDALVLRGPNGSGKTTLLRTIAGFLKPAAGAISVLGGGAGPASGEEMRAEEDANASPAPEAIFHYIGHSNAVKPRLSVMENIAFWQNYYGATGGKNAAEEALSAFGLLGLANFLAGHLSQGQARRLGLARLLASPRPIWLLDEPSVSLDAASARSFERVIATHLFAKGCAIVSTHLDLAIPNAKILELGLRRPLQ
jgi:heme exporter protein A